MEIAILGVLICQLLLLATSLLLAKRLMSSLSRNVRLYFESPDEGKQSPFADTLDNLSARLGAAIIASIKGWLMSQNSIAVRQDKAAARQEIQENAPPILGMLMKYQPGIGKLLGKNPELAQLAMQYLNNRQGAKPPEEVSAGSNGSSGNPFKV
jgi:hypothetical protein